CTGADQRRRSAVPVRLIPPPRPSGKRGRLSSPLAPGGRGVGGEGRTAMPLPLYPVLCYRRGCGRPALYKIAARWSDGLTAELKTYALSCADCLPDWYARSRAKQAACRLAPGETLEEPGIYALLRGQRDPQLPRLPDLEQQFAASP